MVDDALIVGLVTLLFLPTLMHGAPDGHSHHFNHAWATTFSEAWSWSNPYPRWLPGMWQGAGSPDFYFYPPFGFFIVALASKTCCVAAEHSLAVAYWGLHVLSGIGVYRLAQSLGFTRIGCLAVAVALILMPYHLAVVFHRSAIGEMAAFAALGFLLSAITDLLLRGEGAWRIVLTAPICILGHILVAPIIGLAVLCLVVAYRRDLRLDRVLRAAVMGFAGVLIAGAYWVPALLLREADATAYLLLYYWGGQLLTWDAIAVDPFLYIVYIPLFVVTPLALLGAALMWRRSSRTAALSAAIIVACWFMVSPLSVIIWFHTPLSIMQFPWRFLLLFDFGAALGLGLLVERAISQEVTPARALARFGTGGFLGGIAIILVVGHTHWLPTGPIEARLQWKIEERIGPLEWLSLGGRERSFDLDDLTRRRSVMPPLLNAPEVQTLTAGATADLIASDPFQILFEASSSTGMEIVLRRSFWPYWRLEPLDGGPAVPLSATEGHPLVTATLPAGRQQWRLSLATPPSLWLGILVSCLGLALAIGGLVALQRKPRAQQRSA
ncbi:MAG: hypothetical protein AAF675_03765 [Pseudomonadota bacterium]